MTSSRIHVCKPRHVLDQQAGASLSIRFADAIFFVLAVEGNTGEFDPRQLCHPRSLNNLALDPRTLKRGKVQLKNARDVVFSVWFSDHD